MLPTLKKFFRLVAPKLIGEMSRDRHGEGGGAHARSAFEGRAKKSGQPKSPQLVTFGSLPMQTHGYAKFGSRQSSYGFPLSMLDGDDDESQVRTPRVSASNGAARVNTRIVAGYGHGEWDCMRDNGGKPSSAGSQVPIVTTRIEVSYGRSGEVLPEKRIGISG